MRILNGGDINPPDSINTWYDVEEIGEENEEEKGRDQREKPPAFFFPYHPFNQVENPFNPHSTKFWKPEGMRSDRRVPK